MTKKPVSIDIEGEFYHVRFRNPDEFDEIRTPEWASNAANSVSKGSKVRMGEKKDEWLVQSILIKKRAGDEKKAKDLATRIIEKIEKD